MQKYLTLILLLGCSAFGQTTIKATNIKGTTGTFTGTVTTGPLNTSGDINAGTNSIFGGQGLFSGNVTFNKVNSATARASHLDAHADWANDLFFGSSNTAFLSTIGHNNTSGWPVICFFCYGSLTTNAWKYSGATNAPVQMLITSGQVQFNEAPAGTADTDISFINTMATFTPSTATLPNVNATSVTTTGNSSIDGVEVSTPSAPASSHWTMFPQTGKGWCQENSSGTVICIVQPQNFSFVAGTTLSWAVPAAKTEFAGFTSEEMQIDLTEYTQFRLVAGLSSAAAVGAVLRVEYSTNGGTTWVGLETSGGTTHSLPLSPSGAPIVGSWATKDAAATGDVEVRLVGINGDGVTSATFRFLQLQLR
jgi:hypothetical protein